MISYSTRQRELALRVRDRLAESSGPRIDCLDIAYGERFKEQLAWWLSYCHAAVVLLSEDALASPWVRYELSVLVNRERLGELTLIVLLLDGMTPARLAELSALDPHALGDLQGATLATDATDADIDGVLERVAAAAGCELSIERLVHGVNGCLAGVRDTVALARARERLRAELGDADPWLDDPRLADVADQGVKLRWALAGELCAMPVDPLYAPLEELAQAAVVMADQLDRIVDLSAMTVFDAASTATLYAEMRAPRLGVVLGCTRQALAELAPDAALQVHPSAKHRCFWLHEPLTGASPEDYVHQIEQQLRRAIDDDGGDFDRLLARRRRRGHPLVVLLAGCDGLTPKLLAEIRARLPDFSFVVLATAAAGPDAWGRQLKVPVAGPRPAADGWPAHLRDEAQLVDDWRATKGELQELVADEEARR